MTLYSVTHDLDDPQMRCRVEYAYGQALAYVWGRQDVPGSTEVRDTDRSERFAEVWARYIRDYMEQRVFWRPNIQDAYETWSRSRVIDPWFLTCGKLGPR